jgi:uncharacterized protein with NRDE domain
MGVSEQGRFAVVTNIRGFGDPDPRRASRGALVADLLTGQGLHADPAQADLSDFNPFNLIVVDHRHAHFLSNRPETIRSLIGPGVYGLSNGTLDEPWPKTMQLKAHMLEWIVAGAEHPEDLFEPLHIETLPDFGLDPGRPSDAPQEPAITPIFIRNAVYGTRCSTVAAIDAQGKGTMIERRFTPDGNPAGETAIRFAWPA